MDDSLWVHRDKLAQIESKEMEEAGIRVSRPSRTASRNSSRSASRSGVKRPISKDRYGSARNSEDDQRGGAFPEYEDFRPNRISTIPSHHDEEEQNYDGAMDFELRTPEEVAAEQEQQKWRQTAIKPGTSRLPISKNSPMPVPHTVVERDSPLPRSRNGSGAWSGNWEDGMAYNRHRIRSQSIGSQTMLDEQDGTATPRSRPASSHVQGSPQNSSPTSVSLPKSRMSNKATPTSGARKNSIANGTTRATSTSQTKPRAASSSVRENNRPMSSSGHKSRPSTSSSRPLGDAPWLATMYKPDPRLPQDQQLLPTHAKRMMQDQWEKEGKTGTAYDRDFRLLNDEEFAKPKTPKLALDKQRLDLEHPTPALSPRPSPQAGVGSPMSGQSTNQWPLASPKSDTKSETASVRPSTSGGYKITPTIPSPQRPVMSPKITDPPPRMPVVDEKDERKQKKGCCCVVM